MVARLQKVKDKQDESKLRTHISSLSDEGGDLSASDWVRRSRELEAARKEEAFSRAKESPNEEKMSYTSNDLEGIQVMHDRSNFEEGRDVIMTLADSSILEKDDRNKITGLNNAEDVLENVNIRDKEKAEAAEKRKKRAKLPVYSGYDDEEFEESFVVGQARKILAQYDEDKEVQGPRMTLSSVVNPLKRKRKRKKKKKKKKKKEKEKEKEKEKGMKPREQDKPRGTGEPAQSVESADLLATLASEYYNEGELKSFKKKDRKKEKRERKRLGAMEKRVKNALESHGEQATDLEDALLSSGMATIPSSSSFAKDYGSRKRRGGIFVGSSSSTSDDAAEEAKEGDLDTKRLALPPPRSPGKYMEVARVMATTVTTVVGTWRWLHLLKEPAIWPKVKKGTAMKSSWNWAQSGPQRWLQVRTLDQECQLERRRPPKWGFHNLRWKGTMTKV